MEFEIDDHTLEILTKCICQKADEREYKEAYDWIHLKEENKAYFDSLYSAWFATRLTRKNNSDLELQIWNTLNSERNALQNNLNKGRWIKQFGKVAAIIALVISFGFLLYSYFERTNKKSDLYIVEAPKGAKSRITLADGTHVWLNAGSKIEYSAIYNQKERNIYLTGEAYFEVAKNKSKPFRVHAGGIVINALGTAFNVKAYSEEKVVETTLVEGLVSIEKINNGQDKKPFLLKPKQQAVYYKTSSEVVLADTAGYRLQMQSPKQKQLPVSAGEIVLTPEVEPEIYTSWKDKRWVFHNELFGDFALKLERLYDIPIVIEDPVLKEYKLTGSIEEENIELVLKALQLIIPIDYRFEKKQLFIKADNKLKYKFDQILKKSNK
jgi:ferric-dicitrate binding protein FerR (iron transport regulator)